MSMSRFLWSYCRRYVVWLVAALFASLTFAGTTVLLIPIFRTIVSDLFQTDQGFSVFGVSGECGEEEEAAGPAEPAVEPAVPDWLDIDLDAVLDRLVDVIRQIFVHEPDDVLWFLPGLFAIVFLLRSLAAFVNGYLFQKVGLGATNDLRNDLYDRILHQSSRFYGEHPSGELVSRVSNDIAVMQNAVSSRLLDLLQQSITLVGLIWLLLSSHFRLAVVCLIGVPAIVYPVVRFGKGMRKTSHRSQERLADLANLVAEAVRGHRVVKAFGMEAFELQRFRDATERHLRVRLKAQMLSYSSGPVIESTAAIGAAFFLYWAGGAIRAGELEASRLLGFLVTLVMLYDPIRKLNKVNLVVQEAMAAVHRVKDVMEVPNDVVDSTAPQPLPPTGALRFEGVEFSYEQEAVLRGIDLEIREGETVALVGPSGAGKSSLANLIPRFYDPTAGRLMLGGVDVRALSLADLRSRIGVVTQETVLFNDTVRNNIAYGRSDLDLDRVRAAARAAYAEEFVEDLPEGWDTWIGEGGLKLSGGQRQRLAIARALVKDPPILILDEATNALDTESESLVQKALENLMQGRTSVVIAHRLSTIQRADRIVVMEKGRIVEEGRHDELLREGGLYKRLHDLQREGSTE